MNPLRPVSFIPFSSNKTSFEDQTEQKILRDERIASLYKFVRSSSTPISFEALASFIQSVSNENGIIFDSNFNTKNRTNFADFGTARVWNVDGNALFINADSKHDCSLMERDDYVPLSEICLIRDIAPNKKVTFGFVNLEKDGSIFSELLRIGNPFYHNLSMRDILFSKDIMKELSRYPFVFESSNIRFDDVVYGIPQKFKKMFDDVKDPREGAIVTPHVAVENRVSKDIFDAYFLNVLDTTLVTNELNSFATLSKLKNKFVYGVSPRLNTLFQFILEAIISLRVKNPEINLTEHVYPFFIDENKQFDKCFLVDFTAWIATRGPLSMESSSIKTSNMEYILRNLLLQTIHCFVYGKTVLEVGGDLITPIVNIRNLYWLLVTKQKKCFINIDKSPFFNMDLTVDTMKHSCTTDCFSCKFTCKPIELSRYTFAKMRYLITNSCPKVILAGYRNYLIPQVHVAMPQGKGLDNFMSSIEAFVSGLIAAMGSQNAQQGFQIANIIAKIATMAHLACKHSWAALTAMFTSFLIDYGLFELVLTSVGLAIRKFILWIGDKLRTIYKEEAPIDSKARKEFKNGSIPVSTLAKNDKFLVKAIKEIESIFIKSKTAPITIEDRVLCLSHLRLIHTALELNYAKMAVQLPVDFCMEVLNFKDLKPEDMRLYAFMSVHPVPAFCPELQAVHITEKRWTQLVCEEDCKYDPDKIPPAERFVVAEDDYLYNCNPQADENKESEEPDQYTFLSLLSVFGRIFGYRTKEIAIKDGNIIKDFRNCFSGLKTMSDVIAGVTASLNTVLEYLYESVYNVPYANRENSDVLKKMLAWLEKTAEYSEISEANLVCQITNNKEKYEELRNHIVEGENISYLATLRRMRESNRHFWEAKHEFAKKFAGPIRNAYMNFETKNIPFWLALVGTPGVGKSTLIQALVMKICEYEEIQFNKSMIYNRNPYSSYWPLYQGQHTVVIDDLFAMTTTEAMTEVAVSLISMKNIAPYMVEMPCAEDKGKGLFNSKLLITTGNIADIPEDINIADIGAVRRRRDMLVRVLVPDQFYDIDPLTGNRTLKCADTFVPEFYKFLILDGKAEPVVTKNGDLGYMNWNEFIEYFLSHYAYSLEENAVNDSKYLTVLDPKRVVETKKEEFVSALEAKNRSLTSAFPHGLPENLTFSGIPFDKKVAPPSMKSNRLGPEVKTTRYSMPRVQHPDGALRIGGEVFRSVSRVVPQGVYEDVSSKLSDCAKYYLGMQNYLKEKVLKALDEIKFVRNIKATCSIAITLSAIAAVMGIYAAYGMWFKSDELKLEGASAQVNYDERYTKGANKSKIRKGAWSKVDPGRFSSGLAGPLVAKAQGSAFADCIENVQANIGRFYAIDGDTEFSCNFVMLKETFGATVSHLAKLGKSFRFEIGDESYLISNEQIEWYHAQNTDLAFFVITKKSFRQFKNIFSQLIDEKDFDAVVGNSFACLHKTKAREAYVFFGEKAEKATGTYPGFTDGSIEVDRMFVGTMPNMNGLCAGLWFVNSNALSGRIFGLHCAGDETKNFAIATALCKELASSVYDLHLAAKIPVGTLQEPTMAVQVSCQGRADPNLYWNPSMYLTDGVGRISVPSEGKITKTAVMDDRFAPRLISSNSMHESILASHFDHKCAPSALRPFTNKDGVLIEPSAVALTKFKRPINLYKDPEVEDIAEEYMFSKMERKIEFRVLELEEAINASHLEGGLNSLVINTSPGYPMCLDAGGLGKAQYVCKDLTSGHLYPQDNLIEMVDKLFLIAQDQQLLTETILALAFLKDEVRPLDKVEAGKSRVVSAHRVDVICLMRMLFGSYAENLRLEGPTGHCAIGLNSESRDEVKAMYVTQMNIGEGVEGMPFDVEKMDASHGINNVERFATFVQKLYDEFPNGNKFRDFPPEMVVNARRNLFLAVCSCGTVFGNTVYWVVQNSSGQFLTTEFNSWCDWKTWLYSIIKTSINKNIPDSVEDILKHQSIKVMGDDAFPLVSKELSWFTYQDLYDNFALFGYMLTSPDKGEPAYLCSKVPPGNCDFLKRKFVLTSDGELHFALAKEVLYRQVCFVQKRASLALEILETRDICQGAMREAFHHGPEFFSVFKNHINTALLSEGQQPIFMDYHSLKKKWFYKAYQVRPQGDSEIAVERIEKEDVPTTSNTLTQNSDLTGIITEDTVIADITPLIAPNPYEPIDETVKSLQRFNNLGTYSWSSSLAQNNIIAAFNLPGDILKFTHNKDVTNNYQYVRGSFEFEIRIASTISHSGSLIVAFTPCFDSTIAQETNAFSTVFHSSCESHVVLSANSQTAVKVAIPWVNPTNWIDLSEDPTLRAGLCGYLQIQVLNPLRLQGQTAATTVGVSVQGRFVNPEISGYARRTNAIAQGERVQKSSKGLISGVIEDVVGLIPSFSSIPMTMTSALTLAMASKVSSAFTTVKGFDKPNDARAVDRSMLTADVGYANGKGLNVANVLSFDPAVQVGNGSADYCIKDYNLFTNHKQLPSLVFSGTFNASTAVGTTFFSWPVAPWYVQLISGNNAPSHCSNLASLFTGWSGSQQYMIDFKTTKFNAAKLRLIYDPRADYSGNLSDDLAGDVISKVLDINGDTTYCFSIPFIRKNNWELIPDPQFFSATPTNLGTNGRFSLQLVTPLSVANSTADTTIYFNVWQSNGPDTKFIKPRSFITPLPGADSESDEDVSSFQKLRIRPQGELTTGDTRKMFENAFEPLIPAKYVNPSNVYLGEEITSFSEYLHRPVAIDLAGTTAGTAAGFNKAYFPLSADVASGFRYQNSFYRIQDSFRFQRGGYSIKVVVNQTSSTSLTNKYSTFKACNFDRYYLAGSDLSSESVAMSSLGQTLETTQFNNTLHFVVPWYYNFNMFYKGFATAQSFNVFEPGFLLSLGQFTVGEMYISACDDFNLGWPRCPPQWTLE